MSRFGQSLRREFRLEPGVDFINHGSFGAPPVAVLAEAERWRLRMEANPDAFLRDALPGALRVAAAELARFLHAEPADIVFIENATAAINAVLRSLVFGPGDQILLSSQSYGAVRQAVRFVCDRTGAQAVEPRVPVPVRDPAELVDALAPLLTARTRLVIVDHISSPSGVIWPVAEIIALARSHRAPVLVDGAHAPGQLELDLPRSAPTGTPATVTSGSSRRAAAASYGPGGKRSRNSMRFRSRMPMARASPPNSTGPARVTFPPGSPPARASASCKNWALTPCGAIATGWSSQLPRKSRAPGASRSAARRTCTAS
jgi:Aminotransferase class-V